MRWTKKELGILEEEFSIMVWELLLKKLPDKTEQQILRKAHNLGLKRERELLERYYDNENEQWIDVYKTYSGSNIRKYTFALPTPPGISYAEAKSVVEMKAQKLIAENVSTPYVNFLTENNFPHHRDLMFLIYDKILENIDKTEFEKRTKDVLKTMDKEGLIKLNSNGDIKILVPLSKQSKTVENTK